jgi:hypothetical protein
MAQYYMERNGRLSVRCWYRYCTIWWEYGDGMCHMALPIELFELILWVIDIHLKEHSHD